MLMWRPTIMARSHQHHHLPRSDGGKTKSTENAHEKHFSGRTQTELKECHVILSGG